jgi:uncharacterized surface protein with fasciclin (FAS1) repeats
MKNMKSLVITVLLGMLLFANNSLASEGYEEKDGDIVDLAASTKFLSTLVEAVKAGDLVETLRGDGPYTVFAPTNAAFAALPEGTLETLLMPKNRDKLVEILTYHVVAGKV